ncbi:MAG: VTT domain-containing protein [Actinomycetales bacterium]|nr:VTT domain-containing protein [Actinomycetales bacterium]
MVTTPAEPAAQPGAGDGTAVAVPAARIRRRSWLRLGGALAAVLALNVLAYWVMGLPAVTSFLQGLAGSVYLGSFLLALITNATVAVPIPYNPIVLQMMETTSLPWLVALTTAAGATLGESVGFLAGRAGRGSFTGTRFGAWLGRQMAHPRRAFLVLLLVSAPPFPAFDVAGVTAGALGVPAGTFYPAVFLGRLARFLLFAAFTVWVTR